VNSRELAVRVISMADIPGVEEIGFCPECKSARITRDYDRAEVVCGECGLVIQDHLIDPGPEWRTFDSADGKKKARAGTSYSFLVEGKELSTEIDWQNRDCNGRAIPEKNRSQVNRMRKVQQRMRFSRATNRSFNEALMILEKISSKMGIPKSVKDEAAFIYRRAAKKSLIKGRSIELIAVTSLYATCRQRDLPRSLNEIAQVSNVKKKDIGRTYKLLLKNLKISSSVSNPQSYIHRFCSELSLSSIARKKALEVLSKASEKKLVISRHPIGIAAATTYIAAVQCKEWRTQQEVARVAGVTEVTIRKRYQEIARSVGFDPHLG